jgi:hypothetical protein
MGTSGSRWCIRSSSSARAWLHHPVQQACSLGVLLDQHCSCFCVQECWGNSPGDRAFAHNSAAQPARIGLYMPLRFPEV